MMKSQSTFHCFSVLFVLLVFGSSVQARNFRSRMSPNGTVFRCTACHVSPSGGGQRTTFGEAVNSLVSPNGREEFCTPAFAALDSDGDGATNGEEVGDPDGDGEASAGAEVTNPGDPDSTPSLATGATPIGFYSFDDAAAPMTDDSASGNDLVSATADPTYVDDGGVEGGAYDFDATHLEIPIDVNPGTIPELTMGAWVKTSDLSEGQRKIMGHDNGGWDRTIGLDARAAGDGFRYTSFIGNGRPAVGTPGPESEDDWTFIAAVYDHPNNRVTVYVDVDSSTTEDTLVGVTEPTGFGDGFPTMSLGSLRPDNTAEGWIGLIDNAFLFDAALDPGQIRRLRDGGKTAALGGLLPSDPRISLAGDEVFGNVGESPGRVEGMVAISNEGATMPLNLASVTLSGDQMSFYEVVSAPESIAAGATDNVVVAFDPGDVFGDFAASLVIESDDFGAPLTMIDLSARVTRPSMNDWLPPREDLIAYWTFDDAAAPLTDSSGQETMLANDVAEATYNGENGFQGGAFHFDGTERLIADLDVNPSELPQMSWGAWVKTDNVAPGLRKVMGHDDGGWDRTIGLDNRSGEFRYTSFIGTGRPVVDLPGPVNVDDWTFLAAVYDQDAEEVTVYVDLEARSTSDELVVVTEPAVFGAGQSQFSIGNIRPDNANEGWVGLIDNPFVYKSALTAREITSIRDMVGDAILGPDDPNILVSSQTIFGPLETRDPVTRPLTISNNGASNPLNVTNLTVTGEDASYFTPAATPGMIAPGVNAAVDITFDPGGEAGAFSAKLLVESNDAGQPVQTIDLSATTPSSESGDPLLNGPLISPFGTVGSGETSRMVTIENGGATQSLSVNRVTLIGSDASRFTLGDVPTSIAAGANANIPVTFDSEGEFGSFRASLLVVSNDATSRFAEIDISAVVPIQNPEDALIGYYSFDDPSTPFNDDSESGNTLESADVDPTYASETGFQETGAFQFDGTQRLIAPIDINVSKIPELTMGAWVKTEDLDPGLRKIMGHDNGGWDRTIGLDHRLDGGAVDPESFRYTSFIGNGRPVIDLPAPENTVDWTFIATVYNQPKNEVTVYVDLNADTTEDELVSMTEPTVFNVGQDTLSIGSLRPDNDTEGWVGLIDRAFIFETALDPATVKELRNGGILPGSEDPNVRLRGAFGDLGRSPGVVTREITVENRGRENTLTLTGSRITGPNLDNYALSGELPASLEPGESVTLMVTFDPQGRSGGFVAFLEVDTNDEGDPIETLDLSALIPNSNALLAHYKLDETEGTTMLDASGNGVQGVFRTANDGEVLLNEAALASGTAVSLNSAEGAGAGFGEIPTSAGLPALEAFSISMWVNQSAEAATTSVLVAKGSESIGSPFAVAVSGGSLAWFSSGDQTLTTGSVLTPGEPAHVVATYAVVDGDPTAAFFVNGEEAGRDNAVTAIDDSTPSVLQIGAANGSFGFDGIIDDVQIYGEALDLEKITFLLNNPGEVIPGDGGEMTGRPADLFEVVRAADGLQFAIPAGVTANVEYSEDLVTWNVIASGVTESFSDTDADRAGRTAGYYRARVAP
ncbi:MAG: choice-of-anchor D domain-containing protein [Verrucomicrobiaceae bacterium]|nr:choice-of-anchor D domain-containing protein [Verrucomicrobiaceae bacterium]